MRIKEIEPKFKELEEGVDGAMEQIGGLEKRLEQIAAQLQEHERTAIEAAHTGESELTGDDAVFKAAADAAEGPLQEAVDPIQEAESKSETAEVAEEVVEVAEKVGFPVATVEVVFSGDLDPKTAALLEQLKYVDTDLVKVTVDKRE